jgi:hypothetical protein
VWLSIVGIFNGALSLFNKVMDWWSQEALKESGRVEERLKSAEVVMDRQKVSNEIDAQPTPTDKSRILDGM